jgi:hypothetical protein
LALKSTWKALFVVRHHITSRAEEKAQNRNTLQMFGVTVGFRGDAMLSTKLPREFEAKVVAPLRE